MASDLSDYHVLRRVCRLMKMCGLEDYWHDSPDDDSLWYRCFTRITFMLYIMVTILELLEALLNHSYPVDLHNDVIFQGPAHMLIIFRLTAFIVSKRKIRDFHRHVVKACKGFEDDKIMKKLCTKVRTTVFLQYCFAYIIIGLYWYEGFVRAFRKGRFHRNLDTSV